MLQALQQTVRVGTGGKIEVIAPECPEGSEVQVIVLLVPQSDPVEALTAKSLDKGSPENGTKINIAEIQSLVRRYVPEGKSLVDDLIADRRTEAVRE